MSRVRPHVSYGWLTVVLFTILTALVLLTFRDYGVTWDAPLHVEHGRRVIDYYESGCTDRLLLDTPPEELGYTPYYGALFDVLAELVARVAPSHPWDARHLLNAVFGMLGLVATWKTARFLAGGAAGFWAVLLLAMLPSYWGHMFNNPKDIPFAALYMWAVYYLLRMTATLPRVSRAVTIKLGLAVGLALATRIGALVLFVYLGVAVSMFLADALRTPDPKLSLVTTAKGMVLPVLGSTLLAWLLMLVFWPWAHADPIGRPFAALAFFSSFPSGVYVPLYLPRYLLVKLPELALALLVLAVVMLILTLAKRRERLTSPTAQLYTLLALSAVAPVILVTVNKSNLYNGIRHFLFILPPLACLMGVVLSWVVSAVSKKGLALRAAALLGFSAYVVSHVLLLARLHPYQYIYFNAMAGGVRGAAAAGYEIDYWAASMREGVLQLVSTLKERDGEAFETRRYRVLASEPKGCAVIYFPGNFELASEASEAELVVAATVWEQHLSFQGDTLIVVERFGVPLCVVKRLAHGE